MICLDKLGYVWIFADMCEYVLICLNIFRHVQICLGVFEFDWIFSDGILFKCI